MKASLVGQEEPKNEGDANDAKHYPTTPGKQALTDIAKDLEPTAKLAPAAPASPLPPMLSDRAAMERERLERQAARQAHAIKSAGSYTVKKMPAIPAARPSGSSGITTFADLEDKPSESSSSTSRPFPKTAHPLQSPGPFPRDAAGEYYLDGEMRHTALKLGHEATEPTFSPEDVFGKVSPPNRRWPELIPPAFRNNPAYTIQLRPG
jgi:tyrosyl-DNA phosphodiesterase-1